VVADPNPNLTVQLNRQPFGEWLGIRRPARPIVPRFFFAFLAANGVYVNLTSIDDRHKNR
jgi:hypothetical protein